MVAWFSKNHSNFSNLGDIAAIIKRRYGKKYKLVLKHGLNSKIWGGHYWVKMH